MDNRKLLLFTLTTVLIGTLLFGDWQSIGEDPCTSFCFRGGFESYSSGGGNETEDCEVYVTNTSGVVQGCEALSSSSQICFWNRQSRVTGEYCYECVPVCLSSQLSQNIYQFSLATLLLSTSAPLIYVFIMAISSDVSSAKSQVLFSSVMNGV